MEKVANLILVILVAILIGLGYSMASTKPAKTIKEYVLQECEPSALDYARWHLEKEVTMREVCPNGGQYLSQNNGTGIRCYDD